MYELAVDSVAAYQTALAQAETTSRITSTSSYYVPTQNYTYPQASNMMPSADNYHNMGHHNQMMPAQTHAPSSLQAGHNQSALSSNDRAFLAPSHDSVGWHSAPDHRQHRSLSTSIQHSRAVVHALTHDMTREATSAALNLPQNTSHITDMQANPNSVHSSRDSGKHSSGRHCIPGDGMPGAFTHASLPSTVSAPHFDVRESFLAPEESIITEDLDDQGHDSCVSTDVHHLHPPEASEAPGQVQEYARHDEGHEEPCLQDVNRHRERELNISKQKQMLDRQHQIHQELKKQQDIQQELHKQRQIDRQLQTQKQLQLQLEEQELVEQEVRRQQEREQELLAQLQREQELERLQQMQAEMEGRTEEQPAQIKREQKHLMAEQLEQEVVGSKQQTPRQKASEQEKDRSGHIPQHMQRQQELEANQTNVFEVDIHRQNMHTKSKVCIIHFCKPLQQHNANMLYVSLARAMSKPV
jgi:hypothetical protein